MYSKLNEEGKKLLTEYAEVYPQIKSFYRNIRLDVSCKYYRYTEDNKHEKYLPQGTPSVLDRGELYEIRYNSTSADWVFARVDSREIPSPRSDVNQDAQESIRNRVTLRTPAMAYILSKNNSKNQYYSLNLKRNYNDFAKEKGIVVLEFDTAPYASGGRLLEELFFNNTVSDIYRSIGESGGYVIDSIKGIEYDGERMVEIRSHTKDTEWIVRLSRDTWVVKELDYLTTVQSGKCWKKRVATYRKTHEGMPLLSNYRIDNGRFNPDGKKQITQQVQYEVTQLIPGAVDLSEFDVYQFLPPKAKIGEIKPAGLSCCRIAGIAIGIILILLGIYLKIRAARKK
jgi:hypothetical protein